MLGIVQRKLSETAINRRKAQYRRKSSEAGRRFVWAGYGRVFRSYRFRRTFGRWSRADAPLRLGGESVYVFGTLSEAADAKHFGQDHLERRRFTQARFPAPAPAPAD